MESLTKRSPVAGWGKKDDPSGSEGSIEIINVR